MSYEKFSRAGDVNDATTLQRHSRRISGRERSIQQSAAPANVSVNAQGRWVRLDPNGRVVDTDVSADALLERYKGEGPPRLAFVESADELAT